VKGRVVVALILLAGLIAWQVLFLMDARRDTERLRQMSLQPHPHEQLPPDRSRGPKLFQDITEVSKLDFQQAIGPLGTYFMPEINGAGGALFDYDNDGDLDILLINSGRSPQAIGDFPPGTRTENALFRQESDGTFTDVSAGSGLGGSSYGIGCAVGDIDNDGDLDVYITNYGTDRLYQNLGNGSFVEITEQARIQDSEWGTCAAFFDYDRDGWLDLFVANYTSDPVYGHSVACGLTAGRVSYCGPHKFAPTVDRLYHNDGLHTNAAGDRSVRFRDMTTAAGIDAATTAGFGVLCADFTGDHWPDVYVANDMHPNRLWVNQQNGTFRDEAAARGAAVSYEGRPQGSMGVATGDVDGDLDLDIVVSNLATEFTVLYRNDGNGYFVDSSRAVNIWQPTRRHTGWGLALIDLDHDGDLDLPQVNGFVVPNRGMFPPHGEDRFQMHRETILDPHAFLSEYYDDNMLLLNAAGGKFKTTGEDLDDDFSAAKGSARSLIYGDIDNDGDLDLLVTNVGERARLYRNQMANSGHWLSIRAMDPQLNRDVYGAEIVVSMGAKKMLGVVNPSSSYLASNSIPVHFGLGDRDRFDEILVRWPDGTPEVFSAGDADRVVLLRRGDGAPIPAGSSRPLAGSSGR
jgi:hypothetical protein